MPYYPIFHRWNTRPIAVVHARSYPRALELAVQRGLSLVYADLRGIEAGRSFLGGADLRGADLRRARLSGAYLRKARLRSANLGRVDLVAASLGGADLRGADLRGADLRDIDLRRADLRHADLRDADLRGALLTGATLDGVVPDWRWTELILELIRRDRRAGDNSGVSAILAELAFHDDTRPYRWLSIVVRHSGPAGVILRILTSYLRPGDGAPELLRRLAADALSPVELAGRHDVLNPGGRHDVVPGHMATRPVAASAPMHWIRRTTDSPPLFGGVN